MKKITIQWIRERIKEIKEEAWDNEKAHWDEDNLYFIVLKEIAKGHPDAQKLAKEVLKTKKINFVRWYA